MKAGNPPPETAASGAGLERALRESEARLQQVLDNSSAVIFAKDREGRYVFVNRECERLFGRPSRGIIGCTDREIFPPELAARLRHNDLRVLIERRAIEFEETVEAVGAERVYLSSKFPLIDADGEPYAVCGIATDITERKRIESALSSAALAVSTSEGETLFRELARFLATILDVEGAMISVLRDAGSAWMSVRAFCLDGVIHENFDYRLAGTACETVVERGFRFYGSDLGATFPLDADFLRLGIESYAGYPLTDAGGHPIGIIAAISRRPLARPQFVESVLKIFAVRASAELQRLAAEEEVRASQTSYREIFEASEDAIFVHDWDTGAILDVNPRACATYGYTREEMLRLTVDDLSSGEPPYTGAEAAKLIERAKRTGSVRFEWHRRNKDGSLRWDEVLLRSARIGGRPRVLAFTRDITERREAEERRQRLEARLRQAQKMEALGQLTGGIAHDFNNLLTSIMGYILLAMERQARHGDARLAGYLEQAHLSCERARDLIRQMQTFSRGRRGDPRPLSLASAVERALGLLRPSLPASIDLRVDVDPDAPAVLIDPVQLEQVLMNLCINARDALAGAGVVAIAARTARVSDVCASCREAVDGDLVELCVADDGPGIPDPVLEHIFEPFFTTKSEGKGMGMGLATVHGIVHEHGGHLIVETGPGAGARFRVLFPPLSDAPVTQAPAEADRGRLPPAPELRGRVLVVDDEQAVGEFMRELLTSWGLEATSLSRPEQALERLSRSPSSFDLIVTDQTMPGMTGLELARALRGIQVDLPVILYSGHGEGIRQADMRAAGIDTVLSKPVDPAQLAAALARHLAGSQGS